MTLVSLARRALAIVGYYAWTIQTASASVFDGGGLDDGTKVAKEIDGPIQKPLRETVTTILKYVLDFLALAAVVIIIISGIRLLISQGDEEAAKKTKKTILYVIVGLLIILFARVLVGFFTDTFPKAIK